MFLKTPEDLYYFHVVTEKPNQICALWNYDT